MTHFRLTAITTAAALAATLLSAPAEEGLSSYQAIVSVADQKIAVLRDGAVVAKYPISTSKYGVGDSSGSYKTPLGKLKVCEKLGDNLPTGAVIKHRRATGEVIAVNAPGRDPIVTRVLWLDGMEPGNAKAKDRSIYIHGTPEEKNIGRPASYGCIRMKSEDVIALYNELGVGATIDIVNDKLPHLAKYTPPKPTPAPKVEVAKVVPTSAPKVEVAKATPPPAKTEVAKAAPAAPEKPVGPTSPKVIAAIAEARDHEAKIERAMADRAASEAAKPAAKLAKAEPAPAPIAQLDKPAARPAASAKPEKLTLTVARIEKTDKTPAAVVTTSGQVASRKRTNEPKPVVVPTPVDPDRLQFLREHEASLASVRFPSDLSMRDGSSQTSDLAERMKGSILESGLPRH